MDEISTTHAANMGNAIEKQQGYSNRLASILTAQFDSFIIFLQVTL